jgi:hypothetical protein
LRFLLLAISHSCLFCFIISKPTKCLLLTYPQPFLLLYSMSEDLDAFCWLSLK